MSVPFLGSAHLSALGVMRVTGADAASFIHGQLTHDFLLLQPDQARLAGYCSAQGRLLASFIGLRPTPDEIWLVCRRDLLAATLKRLSMFVLRAKATLVDASEELAVYGCIGAAPGTEGPTPYAVEAAWGGALVHLWPSRSARRAMWIGAAPARPDLPAVEPAVWAWHEVQSGVALLDNAVRDQFVPQMLNYESVDGIHFKKGCYPGQEVVARSQFRATIKRRTLLAHAEVPLLPGQDIVAQVDGESVSGLVVSGAPTPPDVGSGHDALVCLPVAQRDAVWTPAAGGTPLQLSDPPYPLRTDL